VIDGPMVRAVTVSATDLTDRRPAFGMVVATARGDLAAEVEIEVETGAAAVELGHRDAHWALEPHEGELAALSRLAGAVWADMVEEQTRPTSRFDFLTRPPEIVRMGGMVFTPKRGRCRLATLGAA
jgi:hypothetical protein